MKEISRRTVLRGSAAVASAVIVNHLAGPANGTASAAEAPLRIAYNEALVTPRAPSWPSLWMGGYGWDKRGNDGSVARELRAHCIVFHDFGTPNVLLRLDAISLPRDVHLEIRRRVVDEERLCGDADFMINTSHTHSGAFLGDTHPAPTVIIDLDPDDIDAVNGTTFILMDILVDLVRTTVRETPIDAVLEFGVGQAEVGYNRARGVDTVLPEVPVLVAKNAETGEPAVALFGCACHPVSRGGDHTFDCDFVGSAAETIAEQTGVMALFFQGLAGDQNPVFGGPDRVEELGDILANAVIDVLGRTDLTPVTGPFRNGITTTDLNFSLDLTDPDVVADLRAAYLDRRDSGNYAGYVQRHAALIIDQIDNDTLPTSIPMPVQVWSLTGLTLVGLAHEVLSTYHYLIHGLLDELGLGDTNVWIMAYTNETQCYVAADDVLWIGQYESGWDEWAGTGIAGIGQSTMAYGWPLPLRSSPPGTDPASDDATETVVLNALRELLAPGRAARR